MPGRTVCLVGADPRSCFGRLFLGIHRIASARRSSGRNFLREMGTLGVRGYQRGFYHPDADCREP